MDDASGMAVNLRFLLWREEVPKDAWARTLAGWLGCDKTRALALLRDELPPTAEEVRILTDRTGIPDEELRFGELAAGPDLLRENLQYLTEGFERGGKKKLAGQLDINPGTLSGWLQGKPVKDKNLSKIKDRLGLPLNVDLRRDALFLSLTPVTECERRQWLHGRIDDLPEEALRELFPALHKLLADS